MIFTKCVTVIVGRCPDIANPEHGRVTFDHESLAPFLPGTNATYSCDLGYGLEGGDEVRTCEMDGFRVLMVFGVEWHQPVLVSSPLNFKYL